MRQTRTEQGAVAVLVALLSIVLFAVAALAVDLSNAFVRKRDVQGQADFAALAGAAELGGQQSGTVPSPVVDAVRDSLNANLPQDDKGQTATISAQLTDGDLANGEVQFANGGLQVVGPPAQVDYSFARVLGFDKTNVNANATVGLFSLGTAMPMYAIDGCDWSNQTITDPAAGAAAPIPPLAFDSDTNDTQLEGLLPAEVTLGASGVTATLSGKKFQDTTQIGFFRAENTDPTAIVPLTSFTPAPPATINNGSLTFEIPTSVTTVEEVWYVRVYNAGGVDKWSARSEAQRLRVGEAVLECDSGSSDGNFGTIKLPRIDPGADSSWLPVNISDGLEEPLSLAIHTTFSADGLCSDGVNGAVVSEKPNLRKGTNCVDTDTGLPAQVATEGLITGYSNTYPGRLRADSSSTSVRGGCAPDDSTNPRTVSMTSNPRINNDVLTCFLTDGTTSLADIAHEGYSGGPVLSPDIYKSPRFFWQPVLKVEPTSGGSNKYSIIDFRAAFLTDELVSSSTVRGIDTASADNGVVVTGNKVTQLKVVFFSTDALPADDNGQVVTPYLGVGPKILRLID